MYIKNNGEQPTKDKDSEKPKINIEFNMEKDGNWALQWDESPNSCFHSNHGVSFLPRIISVDDKTILLIGDFAVRDNLDQLITISSYSTDGGAHVKCADILENGHFGVIASFDYNTINHQSIYLTLDL